MGKRQTQRMLRLMASGEPVELTSAMASVKKLARLAFIAQQFGYEYADVRQGGANNSQLRMLIVPDHGPHARARAAQNRAQYPNAGDGVSVPPLVPDAFELLKARINFDLTGKSAEKRMGYAAVGVTIGCAVIALRLGGASEHIGIAAVIWLLLMAVLGLGLVVTRKRNARYAARLQAAGFAPVTDETGRLRYLPPGGLAGHGNPFGGGPYGAPAPGYGYQPQQPPVPYGQPQQPQPPYAQPQQPQPPYAQPAPGPYGTPAQAPGPYGRPQPPYGRPAPYPQPPQPQQNPHWQPPRP
ncbi:hypothetical protein GCM10010293_00310 [Streptomyces griseoflavus]|uniref:hypothetical protein n=1 Tax=Streptomyces griseoflavus TaxID=35619 RepID=UPI00167E854E|nr:hypothetical protein [Streptomyces griseoflavus]GGV10610.1 hypothetical protein GCM10010293_00310 [Streptomyces griseoflavus]